MDEAMSDEKWRDHFKAWEKSGLSQPDFCREQGINQHSFTYWRSKLGTKKKGVGTFVEVRPAAAAKGFELNLPGGITIKVPPGFDARELSRLLETIK